MTKLFKILLIILVVLVLGNLGFLDFILLKGEGGLWDVGRVVRVARPPASSLAGEVGRGSEEKVASASCELVCQNLIKDEIERQLSELPSTAGQSSVSPKVNQPKIAYVPLVSSGSVSSIDWTDIVPSEFYFDLSDYPNAKEVRFEAFLQSSNGDLVSARLYDQTNKRGVDFSELQSFSTTFIRIQSSATKIWRGNNKYTVQLKSVNGTGVLLKEAKLIIIF